MFTQLSRDDFEAMDHDSSIPRRVSEQIASTVDPRMWDFSGLEYRSVYLEVNEDIKIKQELLLHSDTSSIFTVVGGGWPSFYIDYNPNRMVGVDVNVYQLRHFYRSIANSSNTKSIKLLDGISDGRFGLFISDITVLNELNVGFYSKASVIDVSNVFDYYSPDRGNQRISQIADLMSGGSTLLMSSQNFGRLKYKAESLSNRSDIKIALVEGDDYEDKADILNNFMRIVKV